MSKYGVPVNFRDWGKTRREITTTTTNNGGVVSDMLPQTATPPHGRRGPPSTSPANTPLPPRRCSPHSSSSSSTTSPSRLRTWAKVGPTSVRNLWNLLRETDAGRSLGGKVASLGEDLADAAGSEIGRQCRVDATVSAIRLLESLRTPEVKKALLDQWAVGTCRLVDALASGKRRSRYTSTSPRRCGRSSMRRATRRR